MLIFRIRMNAINLRLKIESIHPHPVMDDKNVNGE